MVTARRRVVWDLSMSPTLYMSTQPVHSADQISEDPRTRFETYLAEWVWMTLKLLCSVGATPSERRMARAMLVRNSIRFVSIPLVMDLAYSYFLSILGPGDSPAVDPSNPWPGKCGTGKGPDTWTSGFEGHWTLNPTQWDNDYYKNLLNITWESMPAPGFNSTVMGDPFTTAQQWKQKGIPFNSTDRKAALMMFTSDLAVSHQYFIKVIRIKALRVLKIADIAYQ